MILLFDGGGSKLNGILLDDQYRMVSHARAGGVNQTQGSYEDCLHNVNSCVDDLFRNGDPKSVEACYYTFIGDHKMLYSALARHTNVLEFKCFGESYGGLLAGSLIDHGICAISGTGATIQWVSNEGTKGLGGWGPVLGDDGSGTWIGHQALRAACREFNHWGEHTLLTELIMEYWKCSNPWDMVKTVHSSQAPFRTVAALTHCVGKAVDAGDPVAISILDEAARLMEVQVRTCIQYYNVPIEDQHVTLCGGGWKTHPDFIKRFQEKLLADCPDARIYRPLFEHVCAGLAYRLIILEQRNRREVYDLMDRNLQLFRISGSEYHEKN